ncbi:uncharacterized protein LOC132555854 [Ylistrum balloti]|uniref:uncharacterized protein LOC132555854 n=1 Tax=Ylistrum balloti TaxID=509963 RepID=UPI002905C915|nr:uncharacterized protein LOC132555854 [Ylistrum balloti]
MSGSQPPQHVKKLEKMTETASHNSIALSCIVVILFMIGQWLQYKFVAIADEWFFDINYLIPPTLLFILETVSFVLFFTVNPLSSISDKVEGIVLVLVCHTFGIFLSGYLAYHSQTLYFTPAALLGLPLLVIQNRSCTGIWETPLGIVCHFFLTCGAILMTSYHGNDNGQGYIALAITFYFNLKNIMLKQMATGSNCLVLRMRVVCTYVSILMLLIFIVGLLGVPNVTSLIIAGLFSSAASVVTLYILLEMVLNKHSVYFVSILHLWSRILLDMIYVSQSSYVSIITGSVVVSIATVVYVVYNSGEKENRSSVILKDCSKVPQNEVYTRMEFLVYVGCVIGLLICVFQPSLSDRDRHNLQIIGMYSTKTAD